MIVPGVRTLPCLALILAATLLGCGKKPGAATTDRPKDQAVPALSHAEAAALNNRGVALMDQNKTSEATALFRRLAAGAPQSPTGAVNLGVALLNFQGNSPKEREEAHKECEAILVKTLKDHPKNAWAAYTLGVLLRYVGRIDDSFEKFAVAYEIDPDDADTCYAYGRALYDKKRYAEAAELFRRAISFEAHFDGAWYNLQATLARLGKNDERQVAIDEQELFRAHPVPLGKKLEEKYNFMGRYATCMREVPPFGEMAKPTDASALGFEWTHLPGARVGATDTTWPTGLVLAAGGNVRDFLEREVLPALGPGLALGDLDGDEKAEIFVADAQGHGFLYAIRDERLEDIGAAKGLLPTTTRTLGGVFADIDHDGHIDLLTFGAGPIQLYRNDGAGRLRAPEAIGAAESVTLALAVFDSDHDGDLDVLSAGYLAWPDAKATSPSALSFPGDFRGGNNHLFSNTRPSMFEPDAPKPPATFVDLGEKTGLAGDDAVRTAGFAIADFDRDGDTDVLEMNDGAPSRLLLNERLWRYTDATKTWGAGDAAAALGALVLDFDQDGRDDVLAMRGADAAAVLMANAGRRFRCETSWSRALPIGAQRGLYAAGDFDNDGDLDLVAADPKNGGLFLVQRDGSAFAPPPGPPAEIKGRFRALTTLDWDGDGRLDLLATTTKGEIVLGRNTTATTGAWVALDLRGKEGFTPSEMWSNTFGVGARAEIAAGALKVHRQVTAANGYLAGTTTTLHAGLGAAKSIDYVRLLWTDLVVQSELDVVAKKRTVLTEENRKPSSCPVVFKRSADGGFEFVTDFLGTGGLGFFVEPGVYAPPDETELVRLGAIATQDGKIELRVAEPMEEICYIDALKLVVVDHPEKTEAHADERLATAEPWPSGAPIVHGRRFHAVQAVEGGSMDSTAEIASTDRVYQKGPRRDRRFIGYLEREMRLELAFDAAAILAERPSPEARLILFLGGWVEYPYSHVNFALWQAGIRGESLSLDVPAENGWRTALEEFGYPAGLTRTMAIDVTEHLRLDEPRVALRTNLEIYLDEVYLGWSSDGARTSEFAFDRAELRELGIPLEYSPDGRSPTIYDYQRLDPRVRWKAMGGGYTRPGDVRALLGAADDFYVIMGPGDEFQLEVEARRLPPLPKGWVRTYFLKADGWCKDMDPYTATPDTVEPFPFHGMKTYPPGPDEPGLAPAKLDALRRTATRSVEATFPLPGSK